jgi:hypothetical protein
MSFSSTRMQASWRRMILYQMTRTYVLFELPEDYTPTLRAPPCRRVDFVARSIMAQMGMKQSGRVWHWT